MGGREVADRGWMKTTTDYLYLHLDNLFTKTNLTLSYSENEINTKRTTAFTNKCKNACIEMETINLLFSI